ncbi:Cysteine desulfurase [Candidatus Westeberhardia cardiocondylae]|uniref:cysteine desulfurase n=1 Tax=Candidatus Westeberhardia cardiocondylae TaxID=1594731 RepID=A0A0H5BX01_9ENTR|nr:aminotransferase class V-fold PLP-dependent enzyme [Candidatus Westeberhardia cardiocondylae]MCR3756421.1 cysteine desulfurase [Candidatus Westeberhardia cardiocondylae]CEN32257.1 Cysteine desulfurase [Candidatus Westeberhardia cardiocondylae]
MKLPIYLDYAATTPVDFRVAKKMMEYLTINGMFGNSSSPHFYGWEAERAIEIARDNIASFLGGIDSTEIVFTSGATESNNLAIKGVAYSYSNKGKHIITSMTEHKSVLNTCYQLEKEGFFVTFLPPDKNGIISLEKLQMEFRDDTVLVSLVHVNNETGVIQDIKKFGELCRSNSILFHVDATQSVGKISINLLDLPIDLMSFSSHKVYGPKGIGCLYIRKKSKICIQAQIHGGGQEYGIRSGTLPVHQIVGMGEAYHILQKEMKTEILRFKALKKFFWKELQKIADVSVNGNVRQSISTLLNVTFHNFDSELLISKLEEIAVSPSSACTSSSLESSYILYAMGLHEHSINSTIRFSFGRFTTFEEIKFVLHKIKIAIFCLRNK